MNSKELCKWLRGNSSGIYRPAAEAADEIERLDKGWHLANVKALENPQNADILDARNAALSKMVESLEREVESLRDVPPAHHMDNIDIGEVL